MDSADLGRLDAGDIDASLIRAARAMLGWSRTEAAQLCEVGINTLARLENGERVPGNRTMADIVRVFEVSGISFLSTSYGPAVAKAQAKKPARSKLATTSRKPDAGNFGVSALATGKGSSTLPEGRPR